MLLNKLKLYLTEASLKALWPIFSGIHSKAYQVEVYLHEVKDHQLESHLPILWGNIILLLGLNNSLSKVLKTSTFWGWTTNIYNSVNLEICCVVLMQL